MTLEFFKSVPVVSFYDEIPIRLFHGYQSKFSFSSFQTFQLEFCQKSRQQRNSLRIPVKILTEIPYKKELALPIKA